MVSSSGGSGWAAAAFPRQMAEAENLTPADTIVLDSPWRWLLTSMRAIGHDSLTANAVAANWRVSAVATVLATVRRPK